MKIKRNISKKISVMLAAIVTVLSCFSVSTSAATAPDSTAIIQQTDNYKKYNEQQINITYRADDEISKKHQFSYSDEYFDKSSTEYNSKLAAISLGLSVSAFSTVESNNYYNANYDCNRQAYLQSAYNSLGFKKVNFYNYDKALNNTENSVAFAIAQKTIKSGAHNNYILINLTLRGAGYGAEWASNVQTGNSYKHQGFNQAATQVFEELTTYINDIKKSNNNIILWISGYSRGGAVGNLVAHDLNNSDILKKDNIYVYTFASPNCIKLSDEDNITDDNVFNITSPLDIVPNLPFNSWGYGKYGNNIVLPSKSDEKIENAYKNKFSEITDSDGKLETYYSSLENIITTLIPDSETYSSASICDILNTSAQSLNLNINFDFLSSIPIFGSSVQDIAHNYIEKNFSTYISRQGTDNKANEQTINFFTNVIKIMYMHTMDEQIDKLKNSSCCITAHMPDHYLYWLDIGAI